MVEMLLKAGADVDKVTNRGVTALHYAVNMNREDLVTHLIRNNSNVKIQDRTGKTPLAVAKQLHFSSIEKKLTKVIGNFVQKGINEAHRWIFRAL